MGTVAKLADFLPEMGRRPPTIRRWMGLIALMALVFGLLAAERTHQRRWEARRAEMSLQRDATSEILGEVLIELQPADAGERERPYQFVGPASDTRVWWIAVRNVGGGGGPPGPDRMRVAGGNGEFALRPIAIEIIDPQWREPILRRLESAYRQRGWRFEVRTPNPVSSQHP